LAERVIPSCRCWWPLLALAGGTALAACSSNAPTGPNENAVPTEYRKEIVALMPTLLDDPTNIRDAAITDPFLAPIPGAGSTGGTRYIVCMRFNPRNYNHEYLGITERVGYFYGGKLNQFVKPAPGQCSGAAYKPFPELEKICLGTTCR
jgi:hypothetical protein